MDATTTLAATNFLFASLAYVFSKKDQVSNIQDKYVLITGCDGGFGRAFAERCHQLGFHVFAACLKEESVQQLKCYADRMIPFKLDVTDSQQIQQAVNLVNAQLPEGQGLWGLVNNAGLCETAFIDWLKIDTFRRLADVNLFGLIDVTCHFLPLIKKERGRIVNMASVAGIHASPLFGAYAVSKFGVVAFCNALRLEMLPFGVGVHCVCPTGFATGMTIPDRMIESTRSRYNDASDDVKESYKLVLAQVEEKIEKLCTKIPTDLSPVVEAVEDALLSRKPKRFYYVGPFTMFYRLLSCCPTSLADWISLKLSSHYTPNMRIISKQ
ncbi:Retinol dehydrogenase 7 [Trichoplax sp. H2]|uniref:Uncharacterized protein n=1 Tax=Trichoplax adhaerens TaxID=10228 RepID=B3RTW4_TRIAD|nr:hypothetical protein TRIADDRAFT_56068 [Trichoplax adhaerens]EDV26208.1 hypothetical protein TRIADDRAFT_56068 [Trichoplax adhaerens]RDD40461.1 Retinol dehydrogenase 7 [Trichoplax sp. H2]|eukprot:XP_002112241.1 hypothetical protein TRIADDRAFT_56068 [Trichoplax adhaerens]